MEHENIKKEIKSLKRELFFSKIKFWIYISMFVLWIALFGAMIYEYYWQNEIPNNFTLAIFILLSIQINTQKP